MSDTTAAAACWAYIGSRTTRERNARGEGITVARFDEASGQLTPVQLVRGLENPSYLTLDRAQRHLYTVHGDRSEASALRIDAASGQLTLLNTACTQGRNPVHLVLTPDERQLLVTNHLGSTVALLPLRADGSLGDAQQLHAFEGPPGPHRIEQQQAKPHYADFTPDGRALLVPDKGLDRIFVLRFDGRQLQGESSKIAAREGAGPRHFAWHPTLPQAFVVNELDSTVTHYAYDAAAQRLQPLQWLSTLPETWCGNSRAAAIAMHPNGRALYASNRGHDSITRYTLDGDGWLRWQDCTPTGGRTPRDFTLSPSGRWLLALNEDSDSILSFAVSADGALTPTGEALHCGSPVCLAFGGPAA